MQPIKLQYGEEDWKDRCNGHRSCSEVLVDISYELKTLFICCIKKRSYIF